MKKILFLPLFQMPSGHHQVADALIRSIEQSTNDVRCKKVDFLSYWNSSLEKMVSFTYLRWIHKFPKTYDWFYQQFMYGAFTQKQLFIVDYLYSLKFEEKMIQLIKEEKPDSIVCTHCFPSAILSRLKQKKVINIPVVNVYTDFFINDIWGKEGIDCHLVNDESMKRELMSRFLVSKNKIIVTGIPVNEQIAPIITPTLNLKRHILIAGGSIGLGQIMNYLNQVKKQANYRYTVLCGKNQKLFEEISSWSVDHIAPRAYISSRKEMNALYEQVDAIVTKPGGITISEAFQKRLPIFIHSALPGQEQVNLQKLIKNQLIIPLHEGMPFEEQLSFILENEWERKALFRKMEEIEKGKEKKAYEVIVDSVIKTPLLNVQPI